MSPPESRATENGHTGGAKDLRKTEGPDGDAGDAGRQHGNDNVNEFGDDKVSTFAGVIDAEQTEEGGNDKERSATDAISSRELGDPGEGNEEAQAGEMKVSGGGEPSGSTRW